MSINELRCVRAAGLARRRLFLQLTSRLRRARSVAATPSRSRERMRFTASTALSPALTSGSRACAFSRAPPFPEGCPPASQSGRAACPNSSAGAARPHLHDQGCRRSMQCRRSLRGDAANPRDEDSAPGGWGAARRKELAAERAAAEEAMRAALEALHKEAPARRTAHLCSHRRRGRRRTPPSSSPRSSRCAWCPSPLCTACLANKTIPSTPHRLGACSTTAIRCRRPFGMPSALLHRSWTTRLAARRDRRSAATRWSRPARPRSRQ